MPKFKCPGTLTSLFTLTSAAGVSDDQSVPDFLARCLCPRKLNQEKSILQFLVFELWSKFLEYFENNAQI